MMLYAEVGILSIAAALALFGLPPDAPDWALLTVSALLAWGAYLVIVDVRKGVR